MKREADGSLRYLSLGKCECNRCRRIRSNGMSCEAFPGAIPAEILSGKRSHRKPYPGDHGLRFEPKKPERK